MFYFIFFNKKNNVSQLNLEELKRQTSSKLKQRKIEKIFIQIANLLRKC